MLRSLTLGLIVTLIGCSSKALTPASAQFPPNNGLGSDGFLARLFVDGAQNAVSVDYSKQVTLSWSSQNTVKCQVFDAADTLISEGLSSDGILTAPLIQSTTYQLTCVDSAGKFVTDSVTVTVRQPSVVALLSIDDGPYSDLVYNTSGMLRWFSINAVSCTLKDPNGSTTNVALNETVGLSTGNMTASGSFTLSCVAADNTRMEKTVYANVRPSISISASTQTGAAPLPGGTIILRWTSANASACLITKDAGLSISSDLQSTGLNQVVNATTNFLATCSKPALNNPTRQLVTTAAVVVNLGVGPVAELKVDGQLNSKSFSYGTFTQSHPNGPDATLSWTSTNASSCVLRKDGTTAALSSLLNGSLNVTSLGAGELKYTLTCSLTGYPDVESSVILYVAQPTDHIIFTTHNVYNGNLGGLAGADAKCQSSANAANLRKDRTWKAVLGDSNNSARNRISIIGNVFAFGRGRIADNQARFWGSAEWGIPNPTAANNDEHAEHVPDTSVATGREVWSGLKIDGTLVSGSSSSVCNNWTSTSGSNYTGDSNQADIDRLHIGSLRSCADNAHLFCISQ